MKKENLKITIDNAQKAFDKGTKENKELLKSLFPEHNFSREITDVVTSYETACDTIGIKPLTISQFAHLPIEDQDSDFASHQINVIAKALNGEWKADYANSKQGKYYPYFIWSDQSAGGSGFSFAVYYCAFSDSAVGSRHSFKSRELAVYAGKTFISIYNRFLKP